MKLRWPLGLYRVSGDSMSPTYKTGDVLLAKRWGRPHAGSVVVAQVQQPLIKRVIRIEPDGGLWLQGDNATASTDSRQFGAISPELVEAIVMSRFRHIVDTLE